MEMDVRVCQRERTRGKLDWAATACRACDLERDCLNSSWLGDQKAAEELRRRGAWSDDFYHLWMLIRRVSASLRKCFGS